MPLTTNATLRGAAPTNAAANRPRLQQTVGTSCTIMVAELLEIPGEELPWGPGDSTSFGKLILIRPACSLYEYDDMVIDDISCRTSQIQI